MYIESTINLRHMYRAYILDDERKAVETLVFLIGHAIPEITDIRTQTDPEVAIQEINANPPDILYLDIQMPRKNGFEVLKSIDHLNFEIIFTTAHDQYAIDAIKVSALDYLLKPVDLDSLKIAFDKFRSRHQKFDYKKEFDSLKKQLQTNRRKRLTLHDINGIQVIELEEVIRLQADGNYTRIHLQNGQVIVNSKTLKEFEDLLDQSGFVRTHKSHLVNIDKITAFLKNEYLVLKDQSEIPVARRKRKGIKELFD